MTFDAFFALLSSLYGSEPWPKPLHKFQGLDRVRRGDELGQAAHAVSTTKAALAEVIGSADPVSSVLGSGFGDVDEPHRKKAKQALGQMLLGKCAEEAFEQIYRSGTQWQEFSLRDDRQGRTDTDYFICNGQGRQVYQINIKFHGALFRRAYEMVGLEPDDCFALATYKINSALTKQKTERLPYFFAIVGVRHLTAEIVGDALPRELLDAAALMHQASRHPSVRGFEDAIVDRLVSTKHATYIETLQKIQQADWYILSARRADMLLRELLFERVFALKVRNFTRVFSGAEVDMHFSLSQDLIPLSRFLQILREEGGHSVTTRLERGEF